MKGWCAMARRVVYRTMHEDSVAHIYGHHVHIAVNHKCGQLSPYVHFSRHVRHFPSQLWLMLRLPQWWRLRRLQLRLIRGGPVDADKKVNQNRKKWIQILPLAKKWSCFEGCLDVSYVHRSYLYILIPSFYRLGEAWAQGREVPCIHMIRFFLVLAFFVRRQSIYFVTSTPKAISAPRMVLSG